MVKKKNANTTFLEKFWVKPTGVIISIASLIGIGIQVGIFKGEIDCKVERMQIIGEYQEKLSGHDENCNRINIGKIENEIKNIHNVVEFLKEKKDEK